MNELLETRNHLNDKLQAVLNIDDAIREAEAYYLKLLMQVEELALQISNRRKEAIEPLEKQVNKMLIQVGMPNATLKVEINKATLGLNGYDDVIFLFDANKSNHF